ncbi:MAG TPA: hypothetical protein DDW50_08790, partial [Firmicutes bacterium]|nr:hypothetical protein [Bacillota bacterium]
MLSDRQYKILTVLHEQRGYITIEMIADHIHCSAKTVRNDIGEIKNYLNLIQVGKIFVKPNKGVFLEAELSEWEKISSCFLQNGSENEEAIKRGQEILYQLLKGKQLKLSIQKMEEQLYVGRNGVEKALARVEPWLTRHQIKLVRKRGVGTCVEGEEYRLRLAMWDLFLSTQQSNLRQEYGRFVVSVNQGPIAEISRREGYCSGYDWSVAECTIREIESNNGFCFGYEAFERLSFRIGLMVTRSRQGKSTDQLPKIEQLYCDGLESEIADQLAERLEKESQCKIPFCEREFLRIILETSEIQGFQNQEISNSFQNRYKHLHRFAAKLISFMGVILKCNFKSERILAENLFLYLRSAIAQLQYDIHVENPFEEQIIQKYPNIYVAAWSASMLFEEELSLNIGKNEVTFLTLFFGGAIERVFSHSRALIVCNYGIGISQILREKLKRNIPGLDIIGVASSQAIETIQASKCDFIISTVPLESPFAGKEVVKVDSFLLPQDEKAIQERMCMSKKYEMPKTIQKKALFTQKELFDPALIDIYPAAYDKGLILKNHSNRLVEMGYVQEGYAYSVLE